jgi:hypothetical protein
LDFAILVEGAPSPASAAAVVSLSRGGGAGAVGLLADGLPAADFTAGISLQDLTLVLSLVDIAPPKNEVRLQNIETKVSLIISKI